MTIKKNDATKVEKEQSQTKEKKITTKREVPKASEPLIYCGPNLQGNKLSQYSVYKGGYPVHLEEEMKNCPAIKRLFVPVSKLATTMTAISKAGTPESIWFEEIKKYNGGDK